MALVQDWYKTVHVLLFKSLGWDMCDCGQRLRVNDVSTYMSITNISSIVD